MTSQLLALSLETLAVLDNGRLKEAFALALRRCQSDCDDRPNVQEARKLSIHFSIVPLAGEDGRLESCNVDFQVVDSQPRRRSKTYNMRAERGALLWNELAPGDARQRTLEVELLPREVPHAG